MNRLYALIPLAATLLASACSNSGSDEVEPAVQADQVRSVKRGVAFNYQLPDDVDLLKSGVSWSYNWGPDQIEEFDRLTVETGIDFCPMAWNGDFDSDRIRTWVAAHPGCRYVLAFNEPNLTDQCDYTPAQAAARWPQLKSLAAELGLRIVSPAMNYGTKEGYSDPVVWLDEFFSMVPVDDVCAIALHCYMGNAQAMASFVERFAKYGKPIWMTEFCAWEQFITNSQAQMNYMSDAVNYLESNPDVERYAWFIPRGAEAENSYPYMFLLSKSQPTALTDCGKVYVNMSSFDKSVWYTKGLPIPAEHYANCNMSETTATQWCESVRLRPTTDTTGVLELTSFRTGKWVEYQVDANRCSSLTLRYQSILEAQISIGIDGDKSDVMTLSGTGGEWRTAVLDIKGLDGRHTLRIGMEKGNINLNTIQID